MRPIRILITATVPATTTPTLPAPLMNTQQQRSPWHSPVPYLFGGLAAMLGLIAFALLILACSYWRLSGRVEDREGGGSGGDGDLENGNEKESDANKTVVNKVYEEKILVIMAGEHNPTFLATPVSGKACDKNFKIEKTGEEKTENIEEKMKESELDNNLDQSTVIPVEEDAEIANRETRQVHEQNS
ncbi:protein GLUTAMINE DUMPER 5-like [Mercurialis annua]|uniref:protein GLUTAMINE DUMPER 5-like n=1 Tax=Mercurialis annua TaxID=3986 RepID=UPI00215F2D11|nr:protein GLUTAMINE DUMPER 5-like [Mercurialis annua]